MDSTPAPDITLALPAYNESQNIVVVLDRCVDVLVRLARPWEILVIDNHSSDDTAERVRDYAARQPGVRLVVHGENRMYSGSCRTAMAEARGNVIAIMDSDGQMDPDDLARFLARLDSGADLVFGWRRRRHDPVFRLAISMVFNALGKWRLGFPWHDLNCGFRAFTRTACQAMDIRHTINMVNPELYVRARVHGLQTAEVEVRHMARTAGKTSHHLGQLWRIFSEVDRYMRSLAADLRSGAPPPA